MSKKRLKKKKNAKDSDEKEKRANALVLKKGKKELEEQNYELRNERKKELVVRF